MNRRSTIRGFCAVLALCFLLSTLFSCVPEESGEGDKVLLISIDGLRSDAVENTEYGRWLVENSAYSLDTTTVFPSVTLTCHMSMFYSVQPNIHGVLSNTYTPSEELGKGITEVLRDGAKTSAIFYNWPEISHVAPFGTVAHDKYAAGAIWGWEETGRELGNACINHIVGVGTDFTFLYLGLLDEWGHRYGWLSDEYYYALNKSFEVAEAVINEALSKNYTVILTSDHGGHDTGHGSDLSEDMTIPMFIIGDGFERGVDFGARSILDVAPTVLDVLGVKAPDYWQGKSLKDNI